LENVGNIGELGNRLRKGANILNERLNVANGNQVADCQDSPHHDNCHVTKIANKSHDGHHQAGQKLGFPSGLVEGIVQSVEFLDALPFAVKGFHNYVTTVHLLNMPVYMPQEFLLLFEVFLRILDHQSGYDGGQGDDHQGDQGHLPADGQHHDEYANHGDRGGDDLGQALVECLTDGVHVVGYAGENLSVAGTVKIFQRYAINLGGDFLAEPVGHFRGHIRHDPSLNVRKQGGKQVQDTYGNQDIPNVWKINPGAGPGNLRHYPFK